MDGRFRRKAKLFFCENERYQRVVNTLKIVVISDKTAIIGRINIRARAVLTLSRENCHYLYRLLTIRSVHHYFDA